MPSRKITPSEIRDLNIKIREATLPEYIRKFLFELGIGKDFVRHTKKCFTMKEKINKCKKYKNSNSSEDTKESGKISQKMEKFHKKNICRKCTQRITTITF